MTLTFTNFANFNFLNIDLKEIHGNAHFSKKMIFRIILSIHGFLFDPRLITLDIEI